MTPNQGKNGENETLTHSDEIHPTFQNFHQLFGLAVDHICICRFGTTAGSVSIVVVVVDVSIGSTFSSGFGIKL